MGQAPPPAPHPACCCRSCCWRQPLWPSRCLVRCGGRRQQEERAGAAPGPSGARNLADGCPPQHNVFRRLASLAPLQRHVIGRPSPGCRRRTRQLVTAAHCSHRLAEGESEAALAAHGRDAFQPLHAHGGRGRAGAARDVVARGRAPEADRAQARRLGLDPSATRRRLAGRAGPRQLRGRSSLGVGREGRSPGPLAFWESPAGGAARASPFGGCRAWSPWA